mmetsp:Transcript_1406/g.2471  ORF Transcript_1406/g.2471 Transcript_1406/m.2471 type:complete len:141 (-) Transcript_1406:256-678(-)
MMPEASEDAPDSETQGEEDEFKEFKDQDIVSEIVNQPPIEYYLDLQFWDRVDPDHRESTHKYNTIGRHYFKIRKYIRQSRWKQLYSEFKYTGDHAALSNRTSCEDVCIDTRYPLLECCMKDEPLMVPQQVINYRLWFKVH